MTDNERDTKFQGFAQLLWDEIEAKVHNTYDFIPEGERLRRDFLPMMHTIIAQRAYDLAAYVLYKTNRGCSMEHIDDLTQWPDLRDFE